MGIPIVVAAACGLKLAMKAEWRESDGRITYNELIITNIIHRGSFVSTPPSVSQKGGGKEERRKGKKVFFP